MVHLRGIASIRSFRPVPRANLHEATERPPDPATLFRTQEELLSKAHELNDWMKNKKSILVLTGAGLSTESGVPDYRGHNGSYHKGHKPMIHDQFMRSSRQRQRYWGRGMIGWKDFDLTQPNSGHKALALMEQQRRVGVLYDDSSEYYAPEDEHRWAISSGQGRMSIITQNVDNLHQRAGAKHVTELHGRTNRLKCTSCGLISSRGAFHEELERMNRDWLDAALAMRKEGDLRADGDAQTDADYGQVIVPECPRCGGFLKPDLVFFGDSVPKHRVQRCRAAVDAADGLLCIGTSLAVHSAFRFVKQAGKNGTPIAILNVGETRAEAEGLNVMKIEAPIGDTLMSCVMMNEQSR